MSFLYCFDCDSIYDSESLTPTDIEGVKYYFCPNKYCDSDRMLVELDEQMIPIIKMLNKKGYETQYCCSGHEWHDFGAYISFETGFDYKGCFKYNPESLEYHKESILEMIKGLTSIPLPPNWYFEFNYNISKTDLEYYIKHSEFKDLPFMQLSNYENMEDGEERRVAEAWDWFKKSKYFSSDKDNIVLKGTADISTNDDQIYYHGFNFSNLTFLTFLFGPNAWNNGIILRYNIDEATDELLFELMDEIPASTIKPDMVEDIFRDIKLGRTVKHKDLYSAYRYQARLEGLMSMMLYATTLPYMDGYCDKDCENCKNNNSDNQLDEKEGYLDADEI